MVNSAHGSQSSSSRRANSGMPAGKLRSTGAKAVNRRPVTTERVRTLRGGVIGICLLAGSGLGIAAFFLDGWATTWTRSRLTAATQTASADELPTALTRLADFDEVGLSNVTRELSAADPLRRQAAERVLRRRFIAWRADPNSVHQRQMTTVLMTLIDTRASLPPAQQRFATELAEESINWPLVADGPPLAVACQRILLDPVWSVQPEDAFTAAEFTSTTDAFGTTSAKAPNATRTNVATGTIPAELFRPLSLGPTQTE